jgi:hypothetical protein
MKNSNNPKVHQSTYIKLLIGITVFALVFHIFILLKFVPYDIAWRGRLTTDQKMYTIEVISIFISLFFICSRPKEKFHQSSFFRENPISDPVDFLWPVCPEYYW